MIPTGGGEVAGPCEPALVQLQDGRILTVFRVDSFKGHWAALSSDGGRHWSAPFATGTWAVSPNLFQLKSGVVVLTSGRPSIGLWLTPPHSFEAGKPQAWEFHNVIKVGKSYCATVIATLGKRPSRPYCLNTSSRPCRYTTLRSRIPPIVTLISTQLCKTGSTVISDRGSRYLTL